MPAINAYSLGGAIVRRRISRAGAAPLLAGDTLTREALMAMPVGNLRALIDNHTIEPWPYRPEREPPEVHVVDVRRGQFLVFEGQKLTPEPVSKDDAEALAASRAN